MSLDPSFYKLSGNPRQEKPKMGSSRDLNPGPVTITLLSNVDYYKQPEATIIPLDHWTSLARQTERIRE